MGWGGWDNQIVRLERRGKRGKLVGRGLRECQVRLVTYFWSSKEFRTRGAGGDLCGLPRSPLSSAARPVPGAPSPQSVARAGRGRLPRLRGRWPRGCSNHRPAERSRTSPGKVPADSPAGRASPRTQPRRDAGHSLRSGRRKRRGRVRRGPRNRSGPSPPARPWRPRGSW